MRIAIISAGNVVRGLASSAARPVRSRPVAGSLARHVGEIPSESQVLTMRASSGSQVDNSGNAVHRHSLAVPQAGRGVSGAENSGDAVLMGDVKRALRRCRCQ
jgi:hypothetical protein